MSSNHIIQINLNLSIWMKAIAIPLLQFSAGKQTEL